MLPERALIGYLGHEPLVYRELTPLENLRLFARLYPSRMRTIASLRCSRASASGTSRRERVSTFSRGMRQRLGLCRVVLHVPQLLLLDEPFNALDVAGAELLDADPRQEFRTTSAIVLATHDPGRVERLASDRLAFP